MWIKIGDEYKKIKENRSSAQPEKDVLRSNRRQITALLQYSLEKVSGLLLQDEIITSEEHNLFVNPEAQYQKKIIKEILDEIQINIAGKLNEFIEEILEEIGTTASENAAKQMSKIS